MRKAVIFSLLFALPLCLLAWPWQWNQFDRNDNRTGRWRDYYSSHPDKLMYKGRYKKGVPVGKWRHYGLQTNLTREEKHLPKQKRIKTVLYHANGKIARTGNAYLFEENGFVKYHWHGDWQFYDSTGTWQGWQFYNRGRTNDSIPMTTKIGLISKTEPKNGSPRKFRSVKF
ncbi:hypothetical protein [Rufibacter sp. LB8]|uniref:hypothetical protein n=1 Tax=Rufibacter sp. LB8 TaxID=2777781 RepID=UPI00178C1859|nr:hypothetical protein [Rufibacter sp. LB8]